VLTDGSKVYNQTDTTAPGVVSYNGQYTWEDCSITAIVKANAFDNGNYAGIGLVGRRIDSDNLYTFVYYKFNNTLKISKKVNVVTTDIVTTPYTLNTSTWYTFKAVLNGSTLELWVNGIKQLSATDTMYSTGQIGLYSHRANSEFDNVSAY